MSARRASAVVALVTCPGPAAAARLADALIRRRVAACVNIVPSIRSVYRWKGKIERAGESLLVIKTPARAFERLRRAVIELHPYDVPEVIALPIKAGHAPYLSWVFRSVSP